MAESISTSVDDKTTTIGAAAHARTANFRCAAVPCVPLRRQKNIFVVVAGQIFVVVSVVAIIVSRERRVDGGLGRSVDERATAAAGTVRKDVGDSSAIKEMEPRSEDTWSKNMTSSAESSVPSQLSIGARPMARPKTNACVKKFFRYYRKVCQLAEQRTMTVDSRYHSGNVSEPSTEPLLEARQHRQELCACVPRHRLIGRINPLSSKLRPPVVLSDDAQVQTVQHGGHWAPTDCVARQRLAVIIPFRDRSGHLQKLLTILHPFLQRQLADYTIFVVEQDTTSVLFNKASLMNAGFREIRWRSSIVRMDSNSSRSNDVIRPFDCYIFHDVDMLPEDDRNFYSCTQRPRHVGAYINKHRYRLRYRHIFGGATAFTPEVFERINGYSNEFYGWGGEDDDILRRIRAKGLGYTRFPQCVATYSMIRHERDVGNPTNSKKSVALKWRPTRYTRDGLATVKYSLISVDEMPLYTRFYISIPPKQPPQAQNAGKKCRNGKGRNCS